MISVFHDPGVQASNTAYSSEADMQEAFARVDRFNASLQANGQFVYACGQSVELRTMQ